jgi:hypothetical protein
VELVFLASVNLRVDVTVYDAAGKARSVVRTALGQSIAVGFTTNDGSALISGLLVSYADGIATIFTLTEVTVVASSTPKGCCA